MLKAEVPDSKTFETPVNSYQCYFYARMAGFTFNIMGFIAQAIISTLVINNASLYNNIQYGTCSFCYKIDECKADYKELIVGFSKTAMEQGMVLSAQTAPTFE